MKYINVMFAGGARFLITLKATPLGSFFRGNSAEKSMSKLLKETRDGESVMKFDRPLLAGWCSHDPFIQLDGRDRKQHCL